ncbi:MAG: adenosine kinase [Parachlamydiaceae bacterium]|nr:adenosine kinase [Parachlamydiaceae bacterium]
MIIKSAYEILGIGTPIIDYIFGVSHDFLANLPGLKGGSIAIEYDKFIELIHESDEAPIQVIGGSATNTIKGLAHLGRSCALFGKIGKDEAGKLFRHEMETLKITPFLPTSNLPTAQVACLISPDYERTMRAHLGAGSEAQPEDLNPEMFKGVKVVHIEGYLLDYKKLVFRAMELAKQAGAKISFDLSSTEIVNQHKIILLDLIHSYVDILFANEDETFALTGKFPEQGCTELQGMCEVVVIKMGKLGNWAATKKYKIYQPALEVINTKDSTGAGDLFASGFLHGYLCNLNLEKCSHFGALLASEVVKVIGADIPSTSWTGIKKMLNNTISLN